MSFIWACNRHGHRHGLPNTRKEVSKQKVCTKHGELNILHCSCVFMRFTPDITQSVRGMNKMLLSLWSSPCVHSSGQGLFCNRPASQPPPAKYFNSLQAGSILIYVTLLDGAIQFFEILSFGPDFDNFCFAL